MEFPLDFLSSLLAFGISLSGALLQGTVGFGLGLVGVPLLVLIDPVFVPGPLLLAALLLNLLVSRRERTAIDFTGVKWAIPGRILGAFFGALLLDLVAKDHLSLVFGGMVLLAVVMTFSGLEIPPTSKNVLLAGTFSGFMGTASAIGGAPMALVYQSQRGARIRGTLSVIFAIGTVISMASLVIIGHFGLREIQAGLVLFPGIIIGFFISRHSARILDRGFIRLAILITSALSGLFVIFRNIF
jgi:uncharacterized membrane protein YfcA